MDHDTPGGRTLAVPPGLCATCVHARIVESSKGSCFVLCGRAATDAAFPRYPALPMLRCRGYEERAREEQRR